MYKVKCFVSDKNVVRIYKDDEKNEFIIYNFLFFWVLIYKVCKVKCLGISDKNVIRIFCIRIIKKIIF